MVFPYQVLVSEAPDGQGYVLVLRPEIPVTIIGPAGAGTFLGLVDTGSDHTIVPKSIADKLGVALRPAPGPPATVFGGRPVSLLLGDLAFALEEGGVRCQWRATVQFFDFALPADEMVVLGHAGFLEYFTATFDGKLGTLTLVPNDELPAVE